MKTSLIAGSIACTVAALAMAPSQSYAGNKEWATAGKILTGVVVVHALGRVVDTDHRDGREEYRERREVRDYRPRYEHRRHHYREYRREPAYCDARPRVIVVEREPEPRCAPRYYEERVERHAPRYYEERTERVIIRRR